MREIVVMTGRFQFGFVDFRHCLTKVPQGQGFGGGAKGTQLRDGRRRIFSKGRKWGAFPSTEEPLEETFTGSRGESDFLRWWDCEVC